MSQITRTYDFDGPLTRTIFVAGKYEYFTFHKVPEAFRKREKVLHVEMPFFQSGKLGRNWELSAATDI